MHHRVLIGDGNADAAESLALFLELNGFFAITAYSGPAVLELAHLTQPHFAVIALHLPQNSGCDVCQRLCSGEVCPRPSRLIALTGLGMPRDLEASREAGFDVHLLKPIDPNKLLKYLQ